MKIACSSNQVDENATTFIVQNRSVMVPELLEFAFVLLSSNCDSRVANLAEVITDAVSSPSIINATVEYYDTKTSLPHVSLGQYGMMGSEWNKLTTIIDKVAQQYQPITELMATELSVIDNNIFLDTKNLYANANLVLKQLYLDLRTSYMSSINTKFMIAQAVNERQHQENNLNKEEVNLIDQHFQNWGIPEDNRLSPHYTLVYNYSQERSYVEKIVRHISVPSELQSITYDKLGIVKIDYWGNPELLLYVCSLG